MAFAFFWFFLSLAVGSYSQRLGRGFWWGFLGSLILSPLLGFIIVAIDGRKKNKCRHCGFRRNFDLIYCPKCGLDKEGFTSAENTERFKPSDDKRRD